MDKTLYFSIGTGRWQEARSAPADLNACMLRAARTPSCYTFLPKECTVTTIGSGIVELAIRVWVAQTGQGGVESLREKEWTVEFRYFQREIQAWPVSLLWGKQRDWTVSFSCPRNILFPELMGASAIVIPPAAVEAVIDSLKSLAKEEFGFSPSWPGRVPGCLKDLEGYVHNPLDPNIHKLKDLIGAGYERCFPREQADNYRPLCRFLGIGQPPKSLRKAYGTLPENVIIYALLRQLGFRDINFIRRFFGHEMMFGHRLCELRYTPETRRLAMGPGENGRQLITLLERFCRWFLRQAPEKRLTSLFLPLAVEAWSQDAVDVLRMFAALEVDRVEDAVSPETRRMMIRYGLTPAVHDRLVAEMNLRNANRGRHWGRRENCLIDYTEKEKCCAGQAGRYRFCLPRDTDELRYYGQHFHNCVASYADSALEKRSLIVAMKLEEYYIACIEVQRNTIVQALGPCNKELSAEHKEIIRQWASQTGLLYA